MEKIKTVDKNESMKSAIGLVLMLGILIIIVLFFEKELHTVGYYIRRLGLLGWFASILLFGIFGATPIPSEPVTVMITTIFGPAGAALITSCGNLLAAMVEYFIGGKVSGVADFNKAREKLPFGLNRIPVDSPVFLLTARMIPGYGPKFISVISGIYKVPFLRYVWTAAVATALGAVIVSFGGHGILTLVGFN